MSGSSLTGDSVAVPAAGAYVMRGDHRPLLGRQRILHAVRDPERPPGAWFPRPAASSRSPSPAASPAPAPSASPTPAPAAARATCCDGVVLLTHDRPERLGFGLALAGALGCPVLVIGTDHGRPDVLRRLAARRPWAPHVVTLPWPAPMPAWSLLAGMATGRDVGAAAVAPGPEARYQDVAAKRNLAIALARCLGWSVVLFVDDDVRGLTASEVRDAAGLLASDGAWVVGWPCLDYPDNSVVCHARRLAGLPQEVFVGSGALLLDVRSPLPMFPPVYNEDWLFLFDLLADERVRIGGSVRQLPFDPFASPDRAQEEEFGDVLAEGLFHLLHEDLPLELAGTAEYWAGVLGERRRVLRHLRTRLGTRRVGCARADAAAAAVAAASAQHGPQLPARLAAYVGAWRTDLDCWRAWLSSMHRVGDLAAALDRVGLPREWCVLD